MLNHAPRTAPASNLELRLRVALVRICLEVVLTAPSSPEGVEGVSGRRNLGEASRGRSPCDCLDIILVRSGAMHLPEPPPGPHPGTWDHDRCTGVAARNKLSAGVALLPLPASRSSVSRSTT
jgi:hypothetical protein